MKILGAGLLSLVILTGVPGRSDGLTGFKGVRGTFRVVSGDAEARGNLAASLALDYWRRTPDTGKEEQVNATMAVASTPRPSLEFYGIFGARSEEKDAQRLSGLLDSELGLKIVRLSDSWFRPGLNLGLSLPIGKDEFSSGRVDALILGAVTVDCKGLESFIPVRVNLNGGYRTGASEGASLPLGLSLELPSRFFTPVVEVSTEQNPGDSLSFRQSPLTFTQGLKASPLRWLWFYLGCDVNLAEETERGVKSELYDWRLFGGVTVARSLSGLGPQKCVIYGKVTDKETGQPLGATVTVKGLERAVRADAETGQYRLEGLEAGLLSLLVEAEGHKRKVVPAVAVQGKTTERNIELASKEIEAFLDLSVVSRKSGGPVAAVLRFEGDRTQEVRTDESGELPGLALAPGSYSMTCSAPGYLNSVEELTLTAGEKERLMISLVGLDEPVVVKGVDFAESSANMKVESDEGIRESARLIESNPEIRFEVCGHTDNTGKASERRELSLKRASVFARFLSKAYGIDEGRLVARGYGDEKPLEDNSTEEGRRANRRIEIRALGIE